MVGHSDCKPWVSKLGEILSSSPSRVSEETTSANTLFIKIIPFYGILKHNKPTPPQFNMRCEDVYKNCQISVTPMA